MSRFQKPLIAFIIGGLLAPYLIWCWAKIAGYGLFAEPAIRAGLRGDALYAILTPIDFATSIVLFLPGAWLLWRLHKDSPVKHAAFALIGFFMVSSALVGLPVLTLGLWPVLSIVLTYVALPVAVMLIAWLHRRAPNNSFKPTPLRGAA